MTREDLILRLERNPRDLPFHAGKMLLAAVKGLEAAVEKEESAIAASTLKQITRINRMR